MLRKNPMAEPRFDSLVERLSPQATVSTSRPSRVLYARDSWPLLLIQTRAGRQERQTPRGGHEAEAEHALVERHRFDSAGLALDDIDYVNAHGTSTPMGDEIELGAVRQLFQGAQNLSMSSTKSSIGHLLGAAGAVEAIFSILAMRDGVVPPTLNLDNPSESCADMDLVPKVAKERDVRAIMTNSFGFGGTNASLVLARDV